MLQFIRDNLARFNAVHGISLIWLKHYVDSYGTPFTCKLVGSKAKLIWQITYGAIGITSNSDSGSDKMTK